MFNQHSLVSNLTFTKNGFEKKVKKTDFQDVENPAYLIGLKNCNMKKKFTFNDFKNQQLTEKESLQTKGGHTRIRRPGNSTTTAIWDDAIIRKKKLLVIGAPDLGVRFTKRGG